VTSILLHLRAARTVFENIDMAKASVFADAIAGRDPIVRTPRRNSRHDGAVHQHPIFGGVEIGAAAMASYVPRSTKLATSHAALVLMGKTRVDSRDPRHLQERPAWLKGGPNR
jgi:hypothetical protein